MSMRIGGLASGMDTDEIIRKLMDAERIPVNKFKQQKQLLEWKRDDYRELNGKIFNFRSAAFDMKLQSDYSIKKVSTSDGNSISVTGTSDANEGTYKIEIDKLAEAANLKSNPLVGGAGAASTLQALGLTADETVFTIGGHKGAAAITLKKEDEISDVVAKINAQSSSTGVSVTYESAMDRLFFVTSKTGASSNITLRMQNTVETAAPDAPTQNLLRDVFKIPSATVDQDSSEIVTGGVPFTSASSLIGQDLTEPVKLKIELDGVMHEYQVSKTTTIAQLVNDINVDLKKSGLYAQLTTDGKLSFVNQDSKPLNFTDTSASGTALLAKLGLDSAKTVESELDFSEFTVSGVNAEVWFNNAFATYESNTFMIAGMNVTAKSISAGPVDVTVTQDVDAVFNKIKSFVDKYNELIDVANKKLTEKKYRDFPPLTDAQREKMSEDEIKRWEEKAKSGTLTADPLVSSGMSSLRLTMSNAITGLPAGQWDTLGDIGISNVLVMGETVSGDYFDRGKLYIDEAKLKQAIAERPEEVMAIFNYDNKNDSTDAGDGIVVRLYDEVSQLYSKITARAGLPLMENDNFEMGKQLGEIDKRLANMNRRLEQVENRYYKQFAAMESYINQMNSQSAWLTSQFSSGGA